MYMACNGELTPGAKTTHQTWKFSNLLSPIMEFMYSQ